MENIKEIRQIDINGTQYFISHNEYNGVKSGIDGTIIHMDASLDNEIYSKVLREYIHIILNK